MKKIASYLLLAVAAFLALLLLVRAVSRVAPAPVLGMGDGTLLPCPANSANCVTTDGETGYVTLEPLRFAGSPERARERLQALMAAQPRTRLVEERGDYLQYVTRSALFQFPDDVAFLIDVERGQIQMRSASRLGVGDLGANQRRLEMLQVAWEGGGGG